MAKEKKNKEPKENSPTDVGGNMGQEKPAEERWIQYNYII